MILPTSLPTVGISVVTMRTLLVTVGKSLLTAAKSRMNGWKWVRTVLECGAT